MAQNFQPPLYWEQFEELTCSVTSKIFHDISPTRIGSPGQAQNGVDVFVRDPRVGPIGIQCKRLSDVNINGRPIPGGPIRPEMLRSEIRKAKSFQPALKLWIFATTAKRDAKIQEEARRLDEHQRANCEFSVRLWFWDDFVSSLNSHIDLQHRYYNDVIKVHSSRDLDRIILHNVSEAFHRPAFEVPLLHEKLDDLMQALKDTQQALRTGELVDRETRHVIRQSIGGWRRIDQPDWRRNLGVIDSDLRKLRGLLEAGLQSGRIVQDRVYLRVSDQNLAAELDRLRDGCIKKLNTILVDAGITPI